MTVSIEDECLASNSNWLRENPIHMTKQRIFTSSEFFQSSVGDPIRSVITESPEATIVAWYIQPQQEIPAHIHPHGQDTWTILAGQGEYYLDRSGVTTPIATGDVVIAPTGSVHGVFNNGDEPLIFISVVSPSTAGYQLVGRESWISPHPPL